ncbi:MAG: dihydroorotate dehydrogenase electron transfer subunit [Muribaculaceae bacterium]|nr:dihydroorotate dehydrogenase electron transfer subunit [Muribaculaceae bacterium]
MHEIKNRKAVIDFKLTENIPLGASYGLLTLESASELPAIQPGQFAQVRIDGSKETFLRRPISICEAGERHVKLLVRRAGPGTDALLRTEPGATVNCMLPLGNGWTLPTKADPELKLLLIGGGVGVAPLLALGRELKSRGYAPEFLLGARSEADLLMLDEFKALGTVHITTDDGSAGTHGVVTAHKRLTHPADQIYCCGPMPMMKAVARAASRLGAPCEVSLENVMACGLGACLCCVEKTMRGNVCVCTEGPVFNVKHLLWQD